MKHLFYQTIFWATLSPYFLVGNLSANDTIGRSDKFLPVFAPQGKIATIKDSEGGYFFGTPKLAPFKDNMGNPIGMVTAFGQGYENSGPIKITHVLSLISYKNSTKASPSSVLDFTIHPIIPKRAYSSVAASTPDVDGPGMAFGSLATLAYKDIKVSPTEYNVAAFDKPVETNSSIIINCNVFNFVTNGDTVGFYSDMKDDGLGLAWRTIQITNLPVRYYNTLAWGQVVKVNVALFAVIEEGVSVDDLNKASLINGTRALMYPNPSAEIARLRFETSIPGNWQLEIISQDGNMLDKSNLGFKNPGEHETIISTDGFSNGTYFYSIINPRGERYTKSFIICK